jgi:tetratricopeptide (TPR) repeat protein
MLNGWSCALLLAASSLAGPATVGESPVSPVERPERPEPHRPEAERTHFDQLQRLIRRPVRLLDRGDLAGAEAAFEAELARHAGRTGRRAIGYSDRLMAMGLALFMQEEGTPRGAEMRRRSLDYLRRAVPATRSAFGADHREAALAIGTYAHAALEILPDDPPAGLEALLADAHRIYAAAYGASDIATARMLLHRAEVLGAPSRTRGDPAAVAAAAELFRQTGPIFERADEVELNGNLLPGGLGIARMYVQHGRIAEALAAADEAAARNKQAPGDKHMRCGYFGLRVQRLAEFMSARGYTAEADAMRERIGREGCGSFDLFAS